MALATVRLWLESNHSSMSFSCTYENAVYEIYKDLMSTVYFPVSKYHLTNIYIVQIYPNFAQNSESESLGGRSK